jgi:hypothetical protein
MLFDHAGLARRLAPGAREPRSMLGAGGKCDGPPGGAGRARRGSWAAVP